MNASFPATLVLFTAISPAAAQALPPGDPHAGQVLAQRTCARCHVVTSGGRQRSAVDAIPSFPTIARSPEVTETSLRVFLQTPHPPMPDFVLTRQEIDDVVSYILALRQR